MTDIRWPLFDLDGDPREDLEVFTKPGEGRIEVFNFFPCSPEKLLPFLKIRLNDVYAFVKKVDPPSYHVIAFKTRIRLGDCEGPEIHFRSYGISPKRAKEIFQRLGVLMCPFREERGFWEKDGQDWLVAPWKAFFDEFERNFHR